MKQIDRFLLAIVAGAALLVVAALALVLTRQEPAYLPEDTPGHIAHNYLLALKRSEYERAYGYLSPTIAGYPADAAAFADDINNYSWEFNQEGATLAVGDEQIMGDRAIITVNETRFYDGGLFSSGQSTRSFNLTLQQQGDAWRLTRGDSYWAYCWTDTDGCR